MSFSPRLTSCSTLIAFDILVVYCASVMAAWYHFKQPLPLNYYRDLLLDCHLLKGSVSINLCLIMLKTSSGEN